MMLPFYRWACTAENRQNNGGLRSSLQRKELFPWRNRFESGIPKEFCLVEPMKLDPLTQQETDRAMMERCIALSSVATSRGELPFAAVISLGERFIVETTNEVAKDADVTRHAELIAIQKAQAILGRKDLSGCTLYSNVEPCAMCSFPVRETRLSRVVYAIGSPMMGGFSKWNVLRDTQISDVMPEAFGGAPEVVAGLLQHEAAEVWRRWNPLAWAVIKHRKCFAEARSDGSCEHMPAIRPARSLIGSLFRLHRRFHLRMGGRALP
jgi:tRNA(adenine34) deaminase